MIKYRIYYLTSNGEMRQTWVNAYSKEDVIEKLKENYWDIDTVINIKKDR